MRHNDLNTGDEKAASISTPNPVDITNRSEKCRYLLSCKAQSRSA